MDRGVVHGEDLDGGAVVEAEQGRDDGVGDGG
jgi:hypothetical protein